MFQDAGFLNFHRATPGELLLVDRFTKIPIFSKGKTKIRKNFFFHAGATRKLLLSNFSNFRLVNKFTEDEPSPKINHDIHSLIHVLIQRKKYLGIPAIQNGIIVELI